MKGISGARQLQVHADHYPRPLSCGAVYLCTSAGVEGLPSSAGKTHQVMSKGEQGIICEGDFRLDVGPVARTARLCSAIDDLGRSLTVLSCIFAGSSSVTYCHEGYTDQNQISFIK